MRVGVSSSWRPLCAAVLVSVVVGACGSLTSILDANAGMMPAAEGQHTTSRKLERTVSYRPALGPPEAVNASLTRELNVAALEQGIALVVDANVTADITLRGYVSALRKGPQVALAYVWDLVDASGQRVHRIAGEETIPVQAADPWTAVTPDVARAFALKTMGEIGQWVRSNPIARTSSPTVSGGAAPSPPAGAGVGVGPAALAPTQSAR